jgi:DNA invertase Pin-like site-specific DNA recombinase
LARRRKPHAHEVRYLSFDPSTPFADQLALYARLSGDDPESVSIEHQIERGETWATRHHKAIVAIYTDIRTGKDPDRLALRQLCLDAQAKRHSGVIFWDDTRLHRGLVGAYPIVRLHAALPKYTFDGTAKKYDIDRIGYAAQQGLDELENTRRRSMEERRVRAANGEWMAGMKPYWLDRDPKTKKPVVAPDRAAAFLAALQIYAAPSGSAREAAQFLTENAPLDPKRNATKAWTSQRFRKLLQNPALWGSLPYARTFEETEHVDGLDIVRKRVDNPEQVPFNVPPLVHENDLERTQCELTGGCERDQYPTGFALSELITERDGKNGGRPWSVSHPLRGVRMLCGCGWRVRWVVRTTKTERVYLYVDCAARVAKGRTLVSDKACGLRNIPVEAPSQQPRPQGGGRASRVSALWPRVQAKLVDELRDPDALVEKQRRLILAEQDIETRSVAEEARLLEEIDAALETLSGREDRLYQDYARDDIDRDLYRRQKSVIENERQGHQQRKHEILAQRLAVTQAERAAGSLQHALRRVSVMDPARFPNELWTKILPDLVETIVLDAEGEPTVNWRRPS